MRIQGFVVMVLCSLMLAGCSVGMAVTGKDQKDVSVLTPGMPRDAAIAKLGPPQTTVADSDGTLIDSWDIVKGNSPSAGRAVAHGAMDVLTLGLWEVVGTPVELAAGKENHTVYTVRYDKDNKITNMTASPGNPAPMPKKSTPTEHKGTVVSPKNT